MLPNMAMSRKRGMFAEDTTPASKMRAGMNPEFRLAFERHDRDRSGTIDLVELSTALQEVKTCVEGWSPNLMRAPNQPFNFSTTTWLATRFAQGGVIAFQQFAEMMQYIGSVKDIFQRIDTNLSGDIDVSELARALSDSGFHIQNSPAGLAVVQQIARNYDTDGDQVMKFDEFLEFRLEWDVYLSQWDAITGGSPHMPPQQLHMIMEEIKKTCEPLSQMAANPMAAGLPGYNANFLNGLYYNSMFKATRPFSEATCARLIMRFGDGSLYITFEQFCVMMEFLKEQKKIFTQHDVDKSGDLNIAELAQAFHKNGLLFQPDMVAQMVRTSDQDGSGTLAFDEYLQMMIEWSQVSQFHSQFQQFAQSRCTARELQQHLGGIRLFYQTIGGVIPAIRPFSIHVCSTLIAMFGHAMPGEFIPSGVTYEEYLMLMHHVKCAAAAFTQASFDASGSISVAEMAMAFARGGINMAPQMIQMMVAAYDINQSGRIEFDEFLQIMVEIQMYQNRMRSMSHFNAATNTVTMDQNQLVQLLYCMPRMMGSRLR